MMKKPVRIGLVIAAALLGDVVIFGAFGSHLFGGRSYAFDDNDLPRHLAGRWDWSNRAHPCGDSAHVITFSPDRRTMTIAMPARPPRDTGWSATYDLLSLEPSLAGRHSWREAPYEGWQTGRVGSRDDGPRRVSVAPHRLAVVQLHRRHTALRIRQRGR